MMIIRGNPSRRSCAEISTYASLNPYRQENELSTTRFPLALQRVRDDG